VYFILAIYRSGKIIAEAAFDMFSVQHVINFYV